MIDLSDPISRQQTITALRALSDDDGYINAPHEVVTDVVRGLPPVKAKHEQTTHSEQTKKDKFGVKTGKTCEDCISRQAAIELYEQFQPYIAVKAVDFKKALEQLPSAQPEQQWIPCSERLPEQGARVLTCSKDGNIWINDYNPIAPTAWAIEPWAVIAWMPLPTPYKEEQDG